MATQMKTEMKSFDQPDETRPFPHGRSEVVKVGGLSMARITLEPGWRWSNDVKPIAGTESCMVEHTQYIESGRLGLRLDSGETYEAGAGAVAYIPPGHDGWVVGDEPAVLIEITGAEPYAKRG